MGLPRSWAWLKSCHPLSLKQELQQTVILWLIPYKKWLYKFRSTSLVSGCHKSKCSHTSTPHSPVFGQGQSPAAPSTGLQGHPESCGGQEWTGERQRFMNRTEGAERTWLNLDKHEGRNQPAASSQNNFFWCHWLLKLHQRVLEIFGDLLLQTTLETTVRVVTASDMNRVAHQCHCFSGCWFPDTGGIVTYVWKMTGVIKKGGKMSNLIKLC